MHGGVSLTLQTRYAQSLITGRLARQGKPAILGLLGSAARLREIWQSAGADDPYADWWLIRIEQALERARDFIGGERERLRARFAEEAALKIQMLTSTRPNRFSLKFANPYAYRIASLIAEFDRLARELLTAERVGLISRATSQHTLQRRSRQMRRLLALPIGYRALGLSRALLQSNLDVTRLATDAMGELPAEILSGARVPTLSPRAPQPTTTTMVAPAGAAAVPLR